MHFTLEIAFFSLIAFICVLFVLITFGWGWVPFILFLIFNMKINLQELESLVHQNEQHVWLSWMHAFVCFNYATAIISAYLFEKNAPQNKKR